MPSGRLVDYLGKGNDSNKPATLDLQEDSLGLYYADDTGILWLWNSSADPDPAWEEFTPAGNLANLGDVDPSDLADGDVLRWNAAAGKWIHYAIPSAPVGEAPEDGDLYARKDGGWEAIPAPVVAFEALSDVDWSTPPTDGQFFMWDAASSKLIPYTLVIPAGSIAGASDYDDSTPAADGQVVAWDETAGKFKPVDQTGGGGSVPAPISARFWALMNLSTTSGSGVNVQLSEVAFKDASGAAIPVSSVTANSTYNSTYVAANLIDGNTATKWAANGYSGKELVFDLGSPKTVAKINLISSSDVPAQAPTQGAIAYSDDGIIWTLVTAFDKGEGWAATETKVVSIPKALVIPVPTGALGIEVIKTWDFSVDGALAAVECDVTGFREIRIVGDAVTTSATAQRVIQCSVDGGTTWPFASGDYAEMGADGSPSNNAAMYPHTTASGVARNFAALLMNLDQSGAHCEAQLLPRGVLAKFQNSNLPINRVRIVPVTGGSTISGTLNGGKITFLGIRKA